MHFKKSNGFWYSILKTKSSQCKTLQEICFNVYIDQHSKNICNFVQNYIPCSWQFDSLQKMTVAAIM